MRPFVVDLYHSDAVQDFAAVKTAGVAAVIHKATQGADFVDHEYTGRRQAATSAGLLWGAYHFGTGADPILQAEFFLDHAAPDSNTLMALDFEDGADPMDIEACADFLDFLGTRIKQKPILYGGSRIREQLPKASDATRKFIASHRLWLSEYGPIAKVPAPWSSFFLWQFTGDGIGPQPHELPGISTRGIDLSTYAGTAEQLADEWAA